MDAKFMEARFKIMVLKLLIFIIARLIAPPDINEIAGATGTERKLMREALDFVKELERM